MSNRPSGLNHLIPPPLIGLITLLLIGLMAHFGPETPCRHPLLTALALLLALFGLSIDLVSLGLFRKARTTVNPLEPEKASQLVTGGLYKISRNPMYLGMLLIILGWAAYQGVFIGLIPVIAFVLYITRFQIIPEERALIRRFGDEYRAYMHRVRRWI